MKPIKKVDSIYSDTFYCLTVKGVFTGRYLQPPITNIFKIFSLDINLLTQPVSLSIKQVSPVVAVMLAVLLCCHPETDLIKWTSNLSLCSSVTQPLPDFAAEKTHKTDGRAIC